MQKEIQISVSKLSIILLFLLLLPLFSLSSVLGSSRTRNILQNDTLMIRIGPIVENLTIKYDSPNSRSTSVSYSINASGYTYIWITPESQGLLNFTILFKTTRIWNETMGIITDNPNFYGSLFSVQPYSGTYSLLLLETDNGISPGNITWNINLQVYGVTKSIFSFVFPTSINAVFFVVGAVLLGYANIFFLLNLHFKSKTEGVSRKQWALIGILILISLFIIYQLYVIST